MNLRWKVKRKAPLVWNNCERSVLFVRRCFPAGRRFSSWQGHSVRNWIEMGCRRPLITILFSIINFPRSSPFSRLWRCLSPRSALRTLSGITVESRLYVQVGTQKFGRRTERDVQVKIIFRITLCKVFWMILYELDVQTSGTCNWETYNWDSNVNRKLTWHR